MQLFLQHGKEEDILELKSYFPDGNVRFNDEENYYDTVEWIANKTGFACNLRTISSA